MAAPLIPTWTMPATIQEQAQQTPPPSYGTGYLFDFSVGDFILDPSGDPLVTNGPEAWGIWCVKAALTQRYAYLAYDARYGCELDRITAASGRAAAESEAAAVIAQALLADPRTKSVDTFSFSWAGDALSVSFVATPVVGTPQQINVQLTAN